MMVVTTWTRAWYHIKSCMVTMKVALVLGRIRKACQYGFLVISDVTKRFVFIIKG